MCGCDVKYTVETGKSVEESSPNYPNSNEASYHCFYEFSTLLNVGDVIRISVLDNRLSCDDDDNTLEVYDAFHTNHRYLGRACAGGTTEFTSPRETLYVVYKTDGQHNMAAHRGFRLVARSQPKFANCYRQEAEVISAAEFPQEITSPYYPMEVAPHVHCRWLLKSPPDHVVYLQVIDGHMAGSDRCNNFGLHVFDGKTSYDDDKLGTFCDNEADLTSFVSSGSYLFVVFISGAPIVNSGGGVKLSFNSVPLDPVTDYSILYVTLVSLVGLLAFTTGLMAVKYLVLPLRQRAHRRHFDPTESPSTMNVNPVTMTFAPDDLPPPYQLTYQVGVSPTREKPVSLFAKFISLFQSREHSGGAGVSSLPNLPTPLGARHSTASTVELVNLDMSMSDVIEADRRHSRGVTLDSPVSDPVWNDYQVLPNVSTRAVFSRGITQIDEETTEYDISDVSHQRDSGIELSVDASDHPGREEVTSNAVEGDMTSNARRELPLPPVPTSLPPSPAPSPPPPRPRNSSLVNSEMEQSITDISDDGEVCASHHSDVTKTVASQSDNDRCYRESEDSPIYTSTGEPPETTTSNFPAKSRIRASEGHYMEPDVPLVSGPVGNKHIVVISVGKSTNVTNRRESIVIESEGHHAEKNNASPRTPANNVTSNSNMKDIRRDLDDESERLSHKDTRHNTPVDDYDDDYIIPEVINTIDNDSGAEQTESTSSNVDTTHQPARHTTSVDSQGYQIPAMSRLYETLDHSTPDRESEYRYLSLQPERDANS